MEITQAVSKDIPELCFLLDSLFNQEIEFESNHEVQARGLGFIINGREVGDILVAKKSGEIIGMVNLLYTISTALGGRVAILEDMVVLPKFRNSGIGSELLTQAIELARKKECRRITVLSDNANEKGHQFYQRQGFARSLMVIFRKSI